MIVSFEDFINGEVEMSPRQGLTIRSAGESGLIWVEETGKNGSYVFDGLITLTDATHFEVR